METVAIPGWPYRIDSAGKFLEVQQYKHNEREIRASLKAI